MSLSLNKAMLIGHVGADPEVRSFQNGGRAASFSLATSKRWKDKQTGEVKEITHWHRVNVLNDNLVNLCSKYVKKGTRLYVEGAMETRKWSDKDGAERYTTEVVLRPYAGEINLLSEKDDPVEAIPEAELE